MRIDKILIFTFSIVLLINCKDIENNYMIITGRVESPINDSLQILDKNYKPIKTIHLSKNNSFYDTIYFSEGYFFLDDGKTTKQLYLTPSFNLDITLIYNKLESIVHFKGNGSNENSYLKYKLINDIEFTAVKNYKYYLKLEEEEFIKLADSIRVERMKFLLGHKNLNENFLLYESFMIEYERAKFINSYKRWKGEFIKNNDFKVSDNFPNPYKNINLSDEKLLSHPEFLNCLVSYVVSKRAYFNIKEESILFDLETIDNEIKNQKIKDKLTYNLVINSIRKTKDIDQVFKKFMLVEKNTDYIKEIENIYFKLKKISKGTISPTFELFDINNNLIKLEDLKGKLVYIDVWATWCIPCIEEIPALKQLEKDFKNKDIYFVSICVNDTRDRFEKIVKEKKMEGIQLFAPKDNISFFEEYLLSGIPRFILIDKEGKIIDANTYNPSNPKIYELILSNIN